jgi:hypothetical protein
MAAARFPNEARIFPCGQLATLRVREAVCEPKQGIQFFPNLPRSALGRASPWA